MNTAYLLLGSNIGNRENYLLQAAELIEKKIGKITSASSLYNTSAWGNENQNDFLNQAVRIKTNFSAEEVLKIILSIEKELGRERNTKWAARIIDIDILFFNQEIISSKDLTIPHPYLHERRFALIPINEIDPNFIHPILNKTVRILLEKCPDKLPVIAAK